MLKASPGMKNFPTLSGISLKEILLTSLHPKFFDHMCIKLRKDSKQAKEMARSMQLSLLIY